MSSNGTRVYVGGLVDGIKKEDLEREFDKYGKLNSVWVALNPPGFAFIEFENLQEAEDACSAMNGTEVLGVTLKVELSRKRDGPRRNNDFRGGDREGGRSFGGRGGGGGGGGGRSFGGPRPGAGGGGGGGGGGGRPFQPYGGGGGGSGGGGRPYNNRQPGGGSYNGGGGGGSGAAAGFRSRSPLSRF